MQRSTRPFRGEAAGLRTPAASHRPLPYFGYVRRLSSNYSFIIRSSFVHSSFLFVHYAKEAIEKICYGILGQLVGAQPISSQSSWGGLEPHGAIFGGLGTVLGGPGAILGALGVVWGGSGSLMASF